MAKTWAEVWDFRASLYSFLGNLILEPITIKNRQFLAKKTWLNFPLGYANDHIKNSLPLLVFVTEQLENVNIDIALEKILIEYTELFLGPGQPKAPPYETYYRSEKRVLFGESTFYMKDKLGKYGLESKQNGKQPEDHLGLELLLVALHSEQLKELPEAELVKAITEKIAFIDEQLLTWVPQLCSDAKVFSKSGYYAAIFELILGVLYWDKELLVEFLTTRQNVAKPVSN